MLQPKYTDGINLFGYFEANHSIGEASRDFLYYCTKSGFKTVAINIDKESESEEIKWVKQFYDKPKEDYVNIFITNLDEVPVVVPSFILNNKATLAVVFWEYESGLEKYKASLNYLDGCIATTEFIGKAIKKVAPNDFPVYYCRYPYVRKEYLIESVTEDESKSIFKLPKDKYLFFYNFDFNSSYKRKNPEAILDAFYQSKLSGKAALVFKTSNAALHKNDYLKFQSKIKDFNLENDIFLVNTYLSRKDYYVLMNGCDAYISLHHGEGLGLGMLEAFDLGIPVIATGYSGNLDFCNDHTCTLVSYKLEKSNDDHPNYSMVKEWAKPSVRDAALAMRCFYANPPSKQTKGATDYLCKEFNLNKFNCCLGYIIACTPLISNALADKESSCKVVLAFKTVIYAFLRKMPFNINIKHRYDILWRRCRASRKAMQRYSFFN